MIADLGDTRRDWLPAQKDWREADFAGILSDREKNEVQDET